jgi:hypothetical protein
VEVFLGEGELTMTAVVYPDAGDVGIEFAERRRRGYARKAGEMGDRELMLSESA